MDKKEKTITNMLRPKLEYAAVLQLPHMLKDIRKLERMQRIAIKMLPEIKDFPYEDRLMERELHINFEGQMGDRSNNDAQVSEQDGKD